MGFAGSGCVGWAAGRRIDQDAGEVFEDRVVGEVAGGEDMGEGCTGLAGAASGFGEMDLDEGAVTSGESGEGMEGFADPGALGPAGTGAGGQGDDGEFAPGERFESGGAEGGGFRGRVPAGGVGDVLVADVLDGGFGAEAVLGEADATIAQVGADLFVLGGIEAAGMEEFVEGTGGGTGGGGAGEEGIEEGLDHAGQFGAGAAGGAEAVEFGALHGGEVLKVAAEQAGDGEGVVAGREEGVVVAEEFRAGAAFIDGVVEDEGVHGEREGMAQFAFEIGHDLLDTGLGGWFAVGGEHEAHAAAAHAAEHPEAPEGGAELGAGAGDEGFGEGVGGPGDDGLEGAEEVAGGGGAEGADIALAEGGFDLAEEVEGGEAGGPFGGGAEEVFLGDHLEDGSDVLGDAAMDEDQGFAEGVTGGVGDLRAIEDVVGGEEAAAGDAVFGVSGSGRTAGDALDAGPDASGILPAAAGAAEPFAEEGTGQDDAAFGFLEGAGEGPGLMGGAHADGDKAAEEVGGDGEAGALGDVVDAGDQFEAASGADHAGEEVGEGETASLDARGDDAAGDDGGLEEAEVVLGEVEDLREGGDVGGAEEVHRGEADDGFLDDAEVGGDGWAGGGIAAVDAEIDGDIEDLGALGEVHAEEEDVAPAAVGEVHPDGGFLAEDGEGAVGTGDEEIRVKAEGLIGGVADAEHPLVAADGTDAATDLVAEGLKGEALVGGGEGGREAVAGALAGLGGEEGVDGFLEAALEEVFVTAERDEGGCAAGGEAGEARGDFEAMKGVEEEEGADALVEVVRAPAEGVEGGAGAEELVEIGVQAPVVEGAIPHRGVG